MSDDPKRPPEAPVHLFADAETEDPLTVHAPIPIGATEGEANYFLGVVNWHKGAIRELVDKVDPVDLVPVLGFLLAAVETQIPEAGPAFDEQREFFGAIYPAVLAANRLEHPEEAPGDQELLIIVPAPTPDKMSLCSTDDGPRIIVPGSKQVN